MASTLDSYQAFINNALGTRGLVFVADYSTNTYSMRLPNGVEYVLSDKIAKDTRDNIGEFLEKEYAKVELLMGRDKVKLDAQEAIVAKLQSKIHMIRKCCEAANTDFSRAIAELTK